MHGEMESAAVLKQAIMIMAHKDFEQLEVLMRCLDYEGFDMYVHVDAKADDVPFDSLEETCSSSSVKFVNRMEVSWGGASQIECELGLIDSALQKGGYSMLHLITGQDMPLRSASEVWRWFDERRDCQFVGFDHSDLTGDITAAERRRFSTYCLGAESRGLLSAVGRRFSILQDVVGVDRTRGTGLVYGKGSAYYSISQGFANWLMDRSAFVRSIFCDRTLCADEVFMQTMLLSSPFVDTRWSPEGDGFEQSARLVDWSRPEGTSPHTWRMEDLDELVSAEGRMFARKFDRSVDAEIIKKLEIRLADSVGEMARV